MRLRILVLAPQPFLTQRGTPIAVHMLLKSLGQAGHACDAVVYGEGEDVGLPNLRLFRVPAPPGLRNMPPGFSVKKLLTDLLMFPIAAWRLARRRYDLVIAVEEAVFAALALKPIFGVPYIYDIDSSIPEQIDDKFNAPAWLRRALVSAEKRAVRGSIGAMPCCAALSELARGYDAELPIQTLEDVSLIEADSAAAPPAVRRVDEPIVTYIGNLERYQGVDLLIEGFAEVVRSGRIARLTIVGGTEAAIAEHRIIAERAGVMEAVTFTGPRPSSEIGQYMGEATIVASPRRQGRNTPMKVYSYLDSGRPLLATRLPTHTQVLDDGIAMLVEPTPEDVARGIRVLLDDPAMRKRLSQNAAERVRNEFSPQAYRRKLTSFLDGQIIPRLAKSAVAANP